MVVDEKDLEKEQQSGGQAGTAQPSTTNAHSKRTNIFPKRGFFKPKETSSTDSASSKRMKPPSLNPFSRMRSPYPFVYEDEVSTVPEGESDKGKGKDQGGKDQGGQSGKK
jgi:hypothetical protein